MRNPDPLIRIGRFSSSGNKFYSEQKINSNHFSSIKIQHFPNLHFFQYNLYSYQIARIKHVQKIQISNWSDLRTICIILVPPHAISIHLLAR